MNDINVLYKLWCSKVKEPELLNELKSVKDKPDEILDRFWQDLTFGTGGLRGVLGAGTNRMNVYTVCRATQGLANYLKSEFSNPSVAVGYDSRINSDTFAHAAAGVLAANGIKVYIFGELMPTPIVAYAVKELKCSSGIIITASHNPSKYNGYKCYDHRGYQMTDAAAEKTLEYINALDMFEDVKHTDFDEAQKAGLIEFIKPDFLDKYFELVKSRLVNPQIAAQSDISVIYAPLNGTGNKPVRRILNMIGIKNVTVVPTQEKPDGNFPTCPFPNPEIREAFNESLKLSKTVNADLLLATDPDCDRCGIAVLHGGEYVLLSGNDVGCLIADYILSQKKLKGTLCKKPVVIKSIVSTDMAAIIAESYGAEVINCLTGFKYIGEIMAELEAKGEGSRFELGFEESYGYLTGLHTRDKDAVNAAMIIVDMAAYYKKQGKDLVEVLGALYKRFGYWDNKLFNYYFEGADGMAKMTDMMNTLRTAYPKELGCNKIAFVTDYKLRKTVNMLTGEETKVTLPVSNVIVMQTQNRDKVIVRPAGTEPKIKIYTMVQGSDKQSAENQTEKYEKDITRVLGIKE